MKANTSVTLRERPKRVGFIDTLRFRTSSVHCNAGFSRQLAENRDHTHHGRAPGT